MFPFLGAAVVCCARVVFGGDVEAEGKGLVEYVLSGIVGGREQLMSGIFRTHGFLDRSHEPEFPISGSTETFVAFDFVSDRVCFRGKQPKWLISTNQDGIETEPQLSAKQIRFVKNNGIVTLWDNFLQTARRDQDGGESIKGSRYYDIRVLGLLNGQSLTAITSTWEATKGILREPIPEVMELR